MIELSVFDSAAVIAESGRTLILGHVSPDGDCLGSAFALAEIISMCSGKADVACDGTVPARLSFISGEVLSPENADADRYDTIISVDVASPTQLGRFEYLIPKIKLMIDHHGVGEPFADNCIRPTASAAGEIVYDIYKELLHQGKIKFCPRVLRLVYAAISSDTGSFKFSNTTPRTHSIAAEIVAGLSAADDSGADTADICRLLFGRFTEREMRAKMIAISNLHLTENGRLGAVVFSRKTLEENSLDERDIGGVIDTPRCIDGVYVALSVRESEPGKFKVSSRSNVDIDVAAVCSKFGGGGHTRAAGCTIFAASADEAERIAVAAFGEAVREYVKNSPAYDLKI